MPRATRRHPAVLLPKSSLTCFLFLDAEPDAASAYTVCAGDILRPRQLAGNQKSNTASARSPIPNAPHFGRDPDPFPYPIDYEGRSYWTFEFLYRTGFMLEKGVFFELE